MPAGLGTSQGHGATHRMMASSSIFTMQYGSLLPVLEEHGTALSAPPATALAPHPNPAGLSWSWATKAFSPGKPPHRGGTLQVPLVGTPQGYGVLGYRGTPRSQRLQRVDLAMAAGTW